MIGPKARVRVFGYPRPCDMRKSFHTLSGLVLEMGHDVVGGDVFAFVSRNRKRTKILWYDGSGLCLLAKRLDAGRFPCLWEQEGSAIELTLSELSLLLEGCQVVGRVPLSPPPFDTATARRVSQTAFR